MKCLAAILLHLAGGEKNKDGEQEHLLREALSLVSVKFNSVLLNEENEDLHEIIDALNIVLTLMAAMNVAFEQPRQPKAQPDRTTAISRLESGLSLLSRGYDRYEKDFVEARKKFGGEKEEVGYFALKIKCDYAKEALRRIKTRKRIEPEKDVPATKTPKSK